MFMWSIFSALINRNATSGSCSRSLLLFPQHHPFCKPLEHRQTSCWHCTKSAFFFFLLGCSQRKNSISSQRFSAPLEANLCACPFFRTCTKYTVECVHTDPDDAAIVFALLNSNYIPRLNVTRFVQKVMRMKLRRS